MAEDILAKLRVAMTVLLFLGGVPGVSCSSALTSGDSCLLRLAGGCAFTVPRRLRPFGPVVEVPDVAAGSASSSRLPGVDGSALTPFMLPGRSSDAALTPVTVPTEWLRKDSPAVDDTTLCGLPARAFPRRLLVRVFDAGSA